MTTLTCPKCRQHAPDHALDAGQCPACGFPFDGPLVLDAEPGRSVVKPLLALAVLLLGAGAAGYAVYARNSEGELAPAVAANNPEPAPTAPADPPPPPAKPPEPPVTKPADPPAPEPANPPAARPLGVVMKVDPKVAATRHFDHPDDTAALPDLNANDRVVLTGRVRGLRIGSVHAKGSIDASGLVAEEVTVTGDLNGEAAVTVNAPNGTVTIGGYVAGSAKLTILAPGGEVVFLASSARLTGTSVTAVTAKRVDVAGKLLGGAKLRATLTAGGSLRVASAEENATVTYRKLAAADPAPTVEKGAIRGGAKVVAE